MKAYGFTLFADYHQFYLQDEAASGDLSAAWDEEANARMLAVAPGTVGVGTVGNMQVPVQLEVHEAEPAQDLGAWDHDVECSLAAPSGRIVIAGCTDYLPDAARCPQPSATAQ